MFQRSWKNPSHPWAETARKNTIRDVIVYKRPKRAETKNPELALIEHKL